MAASTPGELGVEDNGRDGGHAPGGRTGIRSVNKGSGRPAGDQVLVVQTIREKYPPDRVAPTDRFAVAAAP